MKKARDALVEVKNQVSKWAESKPHITQEEKDKLLDAVAKSENWLTEKEEAQVISSSRLAVLPIPSPYFTIIMYV